MIRRHTGQAIVVGDEVEIVVIECGPNRVKLGIRAPRQVAVTRSEVKATREQNVEAARPLAEEDLRRLSERLPGSRTLAGS